MSARPRLGRPYTPAGALSRWGSTVPASDGFTRSRGRWSIAADGGENRGCPAGARIPDIREAARQYTSAGRGPIAHGVSHPDPRTRKHDLAGARDLTARTRD